MVVKRKKWRKPLTEEQKAERRERLKKAREAKAPPKYLSIASDVRELKDDHPLCLKSVRNWIKINKDERARLRKILRKNKDRHVNTRYNIIDCYVQNMEQYLRSGIWTDLFYGENQEFNITYKCVEMAYNLDGTPKRSVGVWYMDLGGKYTQEMYEEDNQIVFKHKRKKHVLTGSAA
jgi:hypothetical protein